VEHGIVKIYPDSEVIVQRAKIKTSTVKINSQEKGITNLDRFEAVESTLKLAIDELARLAYDSEDSKE
jgi:hypothetical protein